MLGGGGGCENNRTVSVRNNERFYFVCRTHVQYVKISIILFLVFGDEEADFRVFL